jgi:hypothetical protein
VDGKATVKSYIRSDNYFKIKAFIVFKDMKKGDRLVAFFHVGWKSGHSPLFVWLVFSLVGCKAEQLSQESCGRNCD